MGCVDSNEMNDGDDQQQTGREECKTGAHD